MFFPNTKPSDGFPSPRKISSSFHGLRLPHPPHSLPLPPHSPAAAFWPSSWSSTHHAHSHLRAFALAVPPAWSSLIPDTCTVHCRTSLEFLLARQLLEKPVLAALSRLQPPPTLLCLSSGTQHYSKHCISGYMFYVWCISSHQEYKHSKIRNCPSVSWRYLFHSGIRRSRTVLGTWKVFAEQMCKWSLWFPVASLKHTALKG